jgi:hypothetical protein
VIECVRERLENPASSWGCEENLMTFLVGNCDIFFWKNVSIQSW